MNIMKEKNYLFCLLTFISLAMTYVGVSSCDDDDEYEMLLSNYTLFNCNNANIQFLNSKNQNKKKKNIGTLEKHSSVQLDTDADYFYITFTDENCQNHQTGKYLSNGTVHIETVIF